MTSLLHSIRKFFLYMSKNSQRHLEESGTDRDSSRQNMASRLDLIMREAGAKQRDRERERERTHTHTHIVRFFKKQTKCDHDGFWWPIFGIKRPQ